MDGWDQLNMERALRQEKKINNSFGIGLIYDLFVNCGSAVAFGGILSTVAVRFRKLHHLKVQVTSV